MREQARLREKGGVLQIYGRGAWRTAYSGECWYCGKQFYYTPHQHDRGRYCSGECVAKSNAKIYARVRPHNTCLVCGKRFPVQKSKAHRYKTCGRKYCQLTLRRRQAFERHKNKGFGDLLQGRDGKFIGVGHEPSD